MTAAEYKAIREGMGWTQERLARELNLSVSTISKREQGSVTVDAEAAHAIRVLAEANGS